MGSWAANRKSGIRNFVYSANMTSNPSTFKTLDKPGYWVSPERHSSESNAYVFDCLIDAHRESTLSVKSGPRCCSLSSNA